MSEATDRLRQVLVNCVEIRRDTTHKQYPYVCATVGLRKDDLVVLLDEADAERAAHLATRQELSAALAEAKERQRALEVAIDERESAFSERNWANERWDEERAEVERLQQVWLMSPEAAKRLDGYRELAEKCAAFEEEIARLTRERDEARCIVEGLEDRVERAEAKRDQAQALFASWQKQALYLQSQHEPCETHHGARRACGQCASSTEQHLANARAEVARLTRERDEERSEVEQLKEIQAQILGSHDAWKARAEKAEAEVERLHEALRRTLECVEGETCGECAEELEVCACDGSAWWRDARAALAGKETP